MRLLPFLIACGLIPGIVVPGHAQGLVDGFMRGQRKAIMAVTYSQSSYDTYYVNKTEVKNPNLGTVTSQALNVYAAYGLDYDLDLIVSAPYVRTEASAGYWQKQEGFQDISAALRWEAFDYKLGKARLSWLFALGYTMPLQHYVIDSPVTIGQGSRNIDGRTLLHFKAGPFFLTGQVGYIRRGKVTLDRIVNYYDPSQLNPNSGSVVNVPDVFEGIVRTGITTKYVYLDVWGQQQRPRNEGTNVAPGIPYPTNAIGFTQVGATLYLRLVKKFGFTGVYGTTINGRNTGKLSRVTAGFVVGL